MRGSSRPRRIPVVITVSEALSHHRQARAAGYRARSRRRRRGTRARPGDPGGPRLAARSKPRPWTATPSASPTSPNPGVWLTERQRLVAAGDAPAPRIAPGEAVRVMTGAPLPPDTEAIVPVEHAQRETGRVAVRRSVPDTGAHLRRRGESILAGGTPRRPGPAPAAGRPRARRPRRRAIRFGSFAGPASRSPSPETSSCLPPQSPAPGRSATRTGRCSRRSAASAAGSPRSPGASPTTPRASRALFAEAGRERGRPAHDAEACPRETSTSCRPRPSARASRCSSTAFPMRPGKPVALGSPRPDALGRTSRQSRLDLGLLPPLRARGAGPPGGRRESGRAGRHRPADPRRHRHRGPRETYRDAWWRIDAGKSLVEPLASAGSHDIGGARPRQRTHPPPGPIAAAQAAGAAVDCLVLGGIESPR